MQRYFMHISPNLGLFRQPATCMKMRIHTCTIVITFKISSYFACLLILNFFWLQVKFKGTKSYNDSFLHEGEQETSKRKPTQHVVEGLVPGTEYEFEVATKAGCSEVAYSVDKASAETDVASKLLCLPELEIHQSSFFHIP